MSAAHRLRTLALGALLVSAGCTEADEAVFDDIGVTRLFLVDPGLGLTSIASSGDRAQVAEWTVQRADLVLGERTFDLLDGESCTLLDTAVQLPGGAGACASGLVLDASVTEPVSASLSLTLGFALRRARPPFLPTGGDSDGDGVPNDGDGSGSAFDEPCTSRTLAGCDDNCPVVANATQADGNDDGFGDACSVVVELSGAFLDSDGDQVIDLADNCVAVPNADTQAPTDPIRRLVGAPCEQQAEVHASGSLSFDLDLGPFDFVQPQGAVTYLVVDFDSRQAVTCNWDFGICSLDPAQVGFCLADSTLAADAGCPAP